MTGTGKATAEQYGTAFEDRMDTVEFRVSPNAHITVDTDVCRGCTTRACLHVCPAKLFVPTADGGLVFNHEQCFECGTCYLVCDADGAITWNYPEGGHGVVFRKG
ncbi:ferredoxin family protein [Streptomyces sp. NPDC002886]|uniref:ferredoxin family protein n=1 Tax=Streptomyces sp. NPDC002886 TaxID=3364667 RepID=UPI0036ABD258